jgi:tRNA A37 methylthiotransferase MiaB
MYEIIQKRNQLMIGREEVIMVSKIDEEDGAISGRTRNFKEVYLPKNEKIQLGDLSSLLRFWKSIGGCSEEKLFSLTL